MLLLGNGDVALLDVALEFLNFALFFLKLVDEIVQLLLEKVVLRLSVEVVDADSRDFIRNVFDLDFFLGNLLIRHFGLLDEVGARFLDRFLLRSVIEDVVTDGLSLGVQLHN